MRIAARRITSLTVRWLAAIGGFLALLWTGVWAIGGKTHLWTFDVMNAGRYTSMAMLTGTLRLRNGVQFASYDEQIHNGALYTNWGFGVPFLQVPFHAIAFRMPSRFPARFFPDRAIYFFYFGVVVALLWAAFHRLLARRSGAAKGRLRRYLLSWSATLVALACSLYPLMSGRFSLYETTICYLELCQLAAIAAYLFAWPDWRWAPTCGLGVAAGMGLLVRPTGLLYVGLWAFMVAAGSRKKRAVAWFVAALAPLFAVWIWTNVVRTGAPFDFGIENSSPGQPYHTQMIRFGSLCANSPAHFREAATRLFHAFFVRQPTEATEWMQQCHFDLEARPPTGEPLSKDAFFGPLVLVLLVWILFTHLARRERRLTAYAPIAAYVALFFAYVLAGGGFGWRYAGDFWPLVVLALVEFVRVLPTAANHWLGMRLAAALVGTSALLYMREVKPALTSVKDAEPGVVASMWREFEDYRYKMDQSVPSSLSCNDRPSWPFHNGLGWNSGPGASCAVGLFTNVYLGLPSTGATKHTVRFRVDHAEEAPLSVYVNGRIYKTRTDHDTYVVDADLDESRFVSPIVQVTIEWKHGPEPPPPVKLRSVELG